MRGSGRTYKVDRPGTESGNVCHEKCVNDTTAVRLRSNRIWSIMARSDGMLKFRTGGLFGEVLSFTSFKHYCIQCLTLCSGIIFLVKSRPLVSDGFICWNWRHLFLFYFSPVFHTIPEKNRITKSRSLIKMLLLTFASVLILKCCVHIFVSNVDFLSNVVQNHRMNQKRSALIWALFHDITPVYKKKVATGAIEITVFACNICCDHRWDY